MKKILLTFLCCLLAAMGLQAETKTYTYDFSTNTKWVTTKGGSTNVKTGSSNKLNAFYYSETGDQFNAGGAGYFNSGYFLWGESGKYIELPVFEGEKITNVTALSSSGHSTSVTVGIYDNTNNMVVSAVKWATTSTNYSYDIPDNYQTSLLRLQVTTAKNAQVKTIVITTESDGNGVDVELAEPEIAWSAESYTATLGEAFELPSLINPNELTVTYESKNANVATIDSEGVVSIVGAGTTVISAEFAGNENYKASTVSYELKVIALGSIKANGSEAADLTVYANSEVVFSAENAESISYKVNGGDAVVANSWTPTEVGSYTVEVTATLATTTNTQTFNITVEEVPAVQTVTLDFSMMGYANGVAVEKIDKDPIIITFDKGSNSNAPKYYTTGSAIRAYGGNTIKLDVAESYVLTKVVMTFASGGNSNGIIANTGTFATETWTSTSETSSVTFTVDGTSGHRRIQKMEVTYALKGSETPDTREEVTLAFEKNEYEATFGKDFEEPQLSITPDAVKDFVVYTSETQNVATVHPQTGEVTLVGAGSTVIKAEFAGNDSYKNASASYTLNVTVNVSSLTDFLAAKPKTNTVIPEPVTVYYQSPDKEYMFITDGTTNMMVYGTLSKAYKNGDVLTGIAGKYEEYKGMPELIPDASTFAEATEGTPIEPKATTLAEEIAPCDYVVLTGVDITDVNGNKNATVTDGAYSIIAYDRFGLSWVATENATIVAIGAVFNSTKQIYIVSVTEEEPVVELGVIMFNDIELVDGHAVGAYVGKAVTISAANAESMSYTINGGEPVDVEGSSFTWTPEAVGEYSFSVSAYLGSDIKTVNFTVTVDENTIKATLICDVLTLSCFGVSGTTYKEVTYTSEECGLTYNAQMAGGNSSIQLRSDNSNSGIVVSENKYGLVAQAAAIKWNSNTAATRTLSFYGQDAAFTAPTELYSTEADNLGEVCVDNGAQQTLSLSGDYCYIGLRSKNKAQYVEQVELFWTLPEPTVYLDKQNAPTTISKLPATLEFASSADEYVKVYYKFNEDGVAVAEAAEGYTEVPAEGLTITTNGILSYYAEVNGWTSGLSTIRFADPTGIVEIEGSEAGEAQWYDLNGRRVAAPGKGIYILKQGNKATKYAF